MKKKKYLLFITLLILLMPTIKANAIVMWMQCTDSEDGALEYYNDVSGGEELAYHNTFAIVNGDMNSVSSIRHIMYNPKDIFGGYGPTFAVYRDKLGGVGSNLSGNICWYESFFPEADQCDSDDMLITESEMNNGVCPIGVVEQDKDAGAVIGDFLIFYGKKMPQPTNTESLNESAFVIYDFEDTYANKKYKIIEGYSTSGLHMFATTMPKNDYNEESTDEYGAYIYNFVGGFNDSINRCYFGENKPDDINDTVAVTGYSKKYITTTAAVQVKIMSRIGRKYFDILGTPEARMINGHFATGETTASTDDLPPDGSYKCNLKNIEGTLIKSTVDDKTLNNKIDDWYKGNSENLSILIDTINSFSPEDENSDYKYKNLMETARAISDAIDNGKDYIFSEDYSARQVATDLNAAYNELEPILTGEFTYNAKQGGCGEENNTTTVDPITSITTNFYCDFFKTYDITKLYGEYQGLLTNVFKEKIDKILQSKMNSSSSPVKFRSISDLIDIAEECTVLLAKATNYIKKNTSVDVEELNNNYLKLIEERGYQLVLDCESLIGEDLQDRIEGYTNIIKIAIPIILIGLGIIDFTKAVFAGDDDQMSKAQKDFLKRLGIAILIFLVPTIVKIVLGIANKVWTFIEPDSCGILETKSSEASFPKIEKDCYHCDSTNVTMWFTPSQMIQDKSCSSKWMIIKDSENDERCRAETK